MLLEEEEEKEEEEDADTDDVFIGTANCDILIATEAEKHVVSTIQPLRTQRSIIYHMKSDYLAYAIAVHHMIQPLLLIVSSYQ